MRPFPAISLGAQEDSGDGGSDIALAELLLRRLANRHGHVKDQCPDPVAHRRDLADLAGALEACGLLDYEAAQGRQPGNSTVVNNYERPGRARR